jgi:hypothetical protein
VDVVVWKIPAETEAETETEAVLWLVSHVAIFESDRGIYLYKRTWTRGTK